MAARKKRQTTEKPTVKPYSRIDNLKGRAKKFTKKHQPTGEAKSAGWAKKKRGQELARLILELKFTGKQGSQIRKDVAAYFNVPEDEITVEQVMLFRQAEKAIQEADTNAFRAVRETAYGQPKQYIDHTTDGEKLQPITGMIIKSSKKK